MNRKTTKKRNWGRDMFGNVMNRAKTWGEKKGKCPKDDRRRTKKSLSESTY